MAALIRARDIQAEVWPISLRERLPVLPVPLRAPDPDVPLDLQAALDTIYAEADYSLTLDYGVPQPSRRSQRRMPSGPPSVCIPGKRHRGDDATTNPCILAADLGRGHRAAFLP